MKIKLMIIAGLISLSVMGIIFSPSLKSLFAPATSNENGGILPSFDGHGIISRIALHHKFISVNGITYRLKPEAGFFTSTHEPASSCWFLKGDTVGYTLDEHCHITSLWLLEQSHKNLK